MGRTIFRVAIAAAGIWIAWSSVGWYVAPGPEEPNGPCGSSGLRCAVCKIMRRDDCNLRPIADCPTTAVDYVNAFPKLEAKLNDEKAAVARWTSFRRDMEAKQNRNAVEACKTNLDQMRKIEAEIPQTDACPGEPNGAGSAPQRAEAAILMHFRDCSERKAHELSVEIKRRSQLQVGDETAQLHSFLKDVTKVMTDSINLLRQVREQESEEKQAKCWLRARIRDCAR